MELSLSMILLLRLLSHELRGLIQRGLCVLNIQRGELFIFTIICKTLSNLPRFILQMDVEISLNEFLNAGLNSAVSKNYVNL